MCGRAALGLSDQQLVALFSLRPLSQQQQQQYRPNYNIRPTTVTPIIRKIQDYNELALLKWGIELSKSTKTIINARCEGISQKPMFRSLLDKQRCIMPIIGFYEWTVDKRPYLIKVKAQEVTSLACLYTKDDTFVIITCDAASSMSKIHDRMPVILTDDEVDRWLNIDQYSFFDCYSLLKPFKGEMEMWQVNPLRGNDESCVKPASKSSQASITSFMRSKGEKTSYQSDSSDKKRSAQQLESQMDKTKKFKFEKIHDIKGKSESSNSDHCLSPEVYSKLERTTNSPKKAPNQKQQAITSFFKSKQ